MIARSTIALAAWLALATTASAQTYPTLTQPVNDFAHVIDPQSAAEMDRRIRSLMAATHDAVVVVTIKTYQPEGSIEQYAVQLFEKAGIGEKKKDNGLLVLLAVDDKRVRIEPGYDLEQFITDGFAGQTIRENMLPAFRQGDYGRGLLDGTTRVIQRIAEGRGVTLADLPPPPKRPAQFPFGGLIFLLVIISIISRIFRRRGPPRRRGPFGGPWSGWYGGVGGFGGGWTGGGGFGGGFGGGGGGGFGGFGGGRSGGGGASGGW